MNLLSKISTKNCGVLPRNCEDLTAKGDTVDVLNIVAKLSDSRIVPGDGEMKDSIEFKGQIVAFNVQTGEEYRSRKMFLPSVAEGYIFDALQAAKAADPTGEVTLRIVVTAEPHNSAKGGFKFKYGCRPFDEPKADDLGNLLAEMNNKPKQLKKSKA
jgi:hypothetical protein